MADSAVKVRQILEAHHGFRTNKAGSRILCLGCGEIMDIDVDSATESSHEMFITHLMEVLRPFTNKFNQLAGPPF